MLTSQDDKFIVCHAKPRLGTRTLTTKMTWHKDVHRGQTTTG